MCVVGLKPAELKRLKSRNIACRRSASTDSGDNPSSVAISRLVFPEKKAISTIRCCK